MSADALADFHKQGTSYGMVNMTFIISLSSSHLSHILSHTEDPCSRREVFVRGAHMAPICRRPRDNQLSLGQTMPDPKAAKTTEHAGCLSGRNKSGLWTEVWRGGRRRGQPRARKSDKKSGVEEGSSRARGHGAGGKPVGRARIEDGRKRGQGHSCLNG